MSEQVRANKKYEICYKMLYFSPHLSICCCTTPRSQKSIFSLKESGYGCSVYTYFGCLLYADDIVLLSHSLGAIRYTVC